MNREMRRLAEREERRQKKKQEKDGGRRRPPVGAPRANAGSLWKRLVGFLHDVRLEMRRVSWPTREQMIAFTTVTLITTVALTLVIFALDFGLKELVLTTIGRVR